MEKPAFCAQPLHQVHSLQAEMTHFGATLSGKHHRRTRILKTNNKILQNDKCALAETVSDNTKGQGICEQNRDSRFDYFFSTIKLAEISSSQTNLRSQYITRM